MYGFGTGFGTGSVVTASGMETLKRTERLVEYVL